VAATGDHPGADPSSVPGGARYAASARCMADPRFAELMAKTRARWERFEAEVTGGPSDAP
jgi:hypothetical protein